MIWVNVRDFSIHSVGNTRGGIVAMSRMRRFVRLAVVPVVMGAAILTGSNPAAADSAWTLRSVHAVKAPVAEDAQAGSVTLLLLDDSAWT
jgi:hypothetical protein